MRVVDDVLIIIFSSIIFLNMLLSARFHQTIRAAFGCGVNLWVNMSHDVLFFAILYSYFLALPMLRLLSYKARGSKDF